MARREPRSGGCRANNNDRVLAVIRDNAASLLREARRCSLCAADAEDAYQRALIIFIERVDRLDEATAGGWLRTVVKHEALAIRAQRSGAVNGEEVDFDRYSGDVPDSEERVLRFDRISRAAEALQRCKGDEVTALILKAEGNSYDEIGQLTGWSYTKVNRCISEGRARFLKTYAAIESGAECERWTTTLSAIADGEATAKDMDQIRPHLRNCAACRAVLRELADAHAAVRIVMPAGLLLAPVATETGGSILTRFYELLVGGIQDSALRVQAAVDAVGSGKAAAVAASAAAVAGGGFAVDRAVLEPNREAVAATRVAAATRTPAPAPSVTATSTPAPEPPPVQTPVPIVKTVPVTPTAEPTPAKREASTEASGEFFGSPSSTQNRPVAKPSKPKRSTPSRTSDAGEFFNP